MFKYWILEDPVLFELTTAFNFNLNTNLKESVEQKLIHYIWPTIRI